MINQIAITKLSVMTRPVMAVRVKIKCPVKITWPAKRKGLPEQILAARIMRCLLHNRV